jgi:hypothetical protein
VLLKQSDEIDVFGHDDGIRESSGEEDVTVPGIA